MVKNLPAMREDGWGSIPDLGRCPGDGHGNPLQYSGLENPMDRGAWQGTVRGSQRVRHNLVANTHTQGKPCINLRNSLFFCVERCQPLDAFLPYAPQLSGPHSLSWFCVGRCSLWMHSFPTHLSYLGHTPFLDCAHPWLLVHLQMWRTAAARFPSTSSSAATKEGGGICWIAGSVVPLGSPHSHLELQIAGIAGSWDISCPPTDMAGNVSLLSILRLRCRMLCTEKGLGGTAPASPNSQWLYNCSLPDKCWKVWIQLVRTCTNAGLA